MKNKMKNRVELGVFIHPNYTINLIIFIILNLISSITIVGVCEILKIPLINFEVMGFVLFVIISTLMEQTLKIFVLRHYVSLILRTFGLILYVAQCLIFYASSIIIEDVNFKNSKILSILGFTILFIIFRNLLIIIYKKYLISKK